MITFKISAPGRIILCGEHTVMYGKQVVAASLGLRTTLKFRQLPLESGMIKIEFPHVNMSLDIPLQMIVNFTSRENYNIIISNYTQFLEEVGYFITFNGLWSTYEQRFSLQIFFFLLLIIARKEELDIQPFRVHLSTELEMNADLGSSTSFATCLAACFLHWSCLQKGDHNGFTPEELERISAYVMSSEEDIQNYVFKQDHMVCTHGRVIAYQCREPLDAQSEMINTPQMYILLVDANFSQNKRQQIKQLAKRKYKDGIATNVLLDQIDYISKEVVEILRKIRDQKTNTNLQSLCDLQAKLSSNQNLLRQLDLSHSNIDLICTIAESCGFRGKLTGDGARNVIILLPPNYHAENNDKVYNLKRCLGDEDFFGKVVTISCAGVRLD
ncbi:mevalonate kinase-like [Camponotus floridanus]|uniref:mevalonate kinase-like n=1 Tax=Camponotus floridanus TaxID=104421 RepID=UPI000DC695C7|nr:mevalonate kinase-like [Camponotus floridanus]XP_025266310.1 mevalonate kinase-like [Camponotus floridanus]